jgi:serine/threonine protein kinase
MYDGKIGTYSDVWGIGCLLYEMIYGIPLFNNLLHQLFNQYQNEDLINQPYEHFRSMVS